MELSIIHILGIIVLFTFLVFIHELGHFLMARRHGIRVEEFGMGIPPRIWGRKVGDTLYSLNLLPVGGFVKLYGEDATDGKALNDSQSFSSKRPWIRAQVLLAGVFMNLLFAVVVLAVIFHMGVPTLTQHPVIQQVLQDGLAQKTGLHVGDEIVKVNQQEIANPNELVSALVNNKNRNVTLLIDRSQELITFETKLDSEGRLGISVANEKIVKYPWHEASYKGIVHSKDITIQLLKGLGTFGATLIRDQKIIEGVSGPVGIAGLISESIDLGWRYVFELSGIISLNLAILNVLPLPALDGGRLLFVVIEGVTKRKVKPQTEALVHTVGFLSLLLLIAVLTYNDIFH
ncbi:hypothetical protein A3A70_02370 [candidate division WWE3 bacterium RIFCSPLOWO2_01_FULL_42_11]|uniref:PDZ domain-containing protein n=1 Tax=candidate division WWE3 bacterium RIFCSPLOWO2_01_FULL_42_11 TaxID=1802627 RepID=A0A1F4VS92_UNCKA|nr:MAG: hypothetical protein A3A70_02370 [candidate division WWE3 bacterium RIFCSPLOWO2_01_FULL_42_11]